MRFRSPSPSRTRRTTSISKMTENTQKVTAYSAEEFNGNAVEPWNDDVDLDPVEKRLQELPGFGPAKPSTIEYVLHYLGHCDLSGAG